jgi:signal transduction histidine kinase
MSRRLFFLSLLLFGMQVLRAQPAVPALRVSTDFDAALIQPMVYEDPQRLLIDQVAQKNVYQAFRDAGSPYLNFGFNQQQWWLYFKLNNLQDKPATYILRLNRKAFDAFKLYQHSEGMPPQLVGNAGAKSKDDDFFLLTGAYFPVKLQPGVNHFWACTRNSMGAAHFSLSLHSMGNFAVYSREVTLIPGVMLGTILMSCFFGLILFYYNREWMYLLYITYTLAILLREVYTFSADFDVFPEAMRHCTSYLIAASFAALFRHFMQLNTRYPRLNIFLQWFARLGLASVGIVLGLAYLGQTTWLRWFFQISAVFNLGFIGLVLYLSFKDYSTYFQAKAMALGTWPLALVFVVITLRNLAIIPSYPLIQFGVSLGFILQLLLFTAALSRWYGIVDGDRKYLQLQLEVKQREKLLAVQTAEHRVKERIGRDLHDDVAASLSGIRIMGQVAEEQFRAKAPEAVPLMQQIIQIAQSSLDRITDIIWALKPHPDYLNDLANRTREYAFRLLENTDLVYHIQIPRTLPAMELDVEARHNIYLIFKEALNNVLKHSQCTEVSIKMDVEAGVMVLEVQDNGRGFSPDLVQKGNGLDNMLARARDIHAELHFHSAPGQGTIVRFTLPLLADH